jgi:hypothetical protein
VDPHHTGIGGPLAGGISGPLVTGISGPLLGGIGGPLRPEYARVPCKSGSESARRRASESGPKRRPDSPLVLVGWGDHSAETLIPSPTTSILAVLGYLRSLSDVLLKRNSMPYLAARSVIFAVSRGIASFPKTLKCSKKCSTPAASECIRSCLGGLISFGIGEVYFSAAERTCPDHQ